VASGLLLVAWHVPDFGALTATRYGSVLSVKVLFVLVAIGLGGLNRFVIQRSLTGNAGFSTALADGGTRRPDRWTVIRWFVRSVRVELTVFLLILALTGALTSLPTATVAEQSTTDVAEDRIVLTGESGSIEIRMEVVPARVGQNTIELSFVRVALVEIDHNVSLSLTHTETGIELPHKTLTVSENGHYSGTVVFPTHGQWNVQVSTRINGRPVTEQFIVRIPTGDTGEATEVEPSNRNETRDGRFAWFMQVGALLVATVAMLAVGYDLFTRFDGHYR
jgi:copper transport protein